MQSFINFGCALKKGGSMKVLFFIYTDGGHIDKFEIRISSKSYSTAIRVFFESYKFTEQGQLKGFMGNKCVANFSAEIGSDFFNWVGS